MYNLPATPGSEVGKPEKSILEPSTFKLPEAVIWDKVSILPDATIDKPLSPASAFILSLSPLFEICRVGSWLPLPAINFNADAPPPPKPCSISTVFTNWDPPRILREPVIFLMVDTPD